MPCARPTPEPSAGMEPQSCSLLPPAWAGPGRPVASVRSLPPGACSPPPGWHLSPLLPCVCHSCLDRMWHPGRDRGSSSAQPSSGAVLWGPWPACPAEVVGPDFIHLRAACLERAVSPGTGHRAPRVAGPPPVSRTEEVVRLFCSSGSVCSHSILPIVSAACTAGHIPVLSSLPGCSSFFIRQYQNCALCSGLLFPDVLPDSTASNPAVASKGRPAR